uniref:Glycosyltransferase n=1 Tax=candidate division WOR-3 bacterium TaxID=2052148 RepID=A0A7V3ZYC5_UNCW3
MLDGEKSAKRYEPEKIDIENPNVCYAIELKLIGKNKTVLEVGPSTGYVTRILKSFGNRVYCIEIDGEAAKEAEKYCDKMIVGDIEEIDLDSYFEPEMFDVILFGDVLEHLKWPNKVLKKVKKFLKPDGYIVASIPNIAHGDIILSLICGKFEYKSLGLLDETHLRFFTLENIFKMFKESGYKIAEVYSTKVEVGYSEFGDVVKKVPTPIVNFIKKLPYSNVYQFVVKAYHAEYPAKEAEIEEISISSIPIDEIVDLQRKVFEYEKELRDLKISVELREERIKELRDRLEKLEAEIRKRDDKISELENSLSSKVEEIENLKQKIENLRIAINEKDLGLKVANEEKAKLEESIRQRELRISELEAVLKSKDDELRNLQQKIESLKLNLNEKNQEIEKLINELEKLKKDLDVKDERISILSSSLEEKIKEVNELKVKLINLRRNSELLETEIKRKEELVERLEKNLAEANDKLKEAREENIRLREEVSAKDEQIRKLTEDVIRLSLELESIKSSVTWRAVMKWHSLVERIAPLGTRRRRWYDLGIKGLRVLVNEGFKGLRKSYSTYQASKKIESQSSEVVQIPTLEDWKGNEIVFPTLPQNPEVSIVIPVYNNSNLTYNCLRSILLHTNGLYEVVLVDDNSQEKEAQELLKKIKNVRIIRNKENMGFVESCNIGAKASRGKYILFLNNDTLVTENWLTPLLDLIKREDVGAVGAKLVYPDGKLQEAGGIIWKDASGWNYGRYDDPDKPEYNFVREVDYCSGAALMVKREIWEKIGGFDRRFKPAYYEDTDLCFSIRKMGYKVLYQPKSVIIHFEGATSGRDTSSGIKRFQEINRRKFYEKWKDVLLKEHYDPNPSNLFLARSRRKGKNILVIDHHVPTFDKDSGSYRMYNILKILSELGHNVTFIGDNLAKMEPYTNVLQQMGVEVIYGSYVKSIEDYLKDYGRFFDVVILSRAPIAEKHITAVCKYCNNAKIIFDTVDLHFLREMRRAEIEKNNAIRRRAEMLKELELRLARIADLTLVVSPHEKELLIKEDPTLKIEILSNIHEVKPPVNSFDSRRDIMFLGGFAHPPNIDAVQWFVKEIFPIVKQQLPEVRFFIVGSNPPKEVTSLKSEDIIVTGYVKDLKPYFESCRVFVAPLRYGAGVKGKIGEAMAHGLPVVTTSIGAEGMGLIDGENALIADNPKEFAEKVIRLYKDNELWEKISKKSIEHIQHNFSYDIAKNKLCELIESLTGGEVHGKEI